MEYAAAAGDDITFLDLLEEMEEQIDELAAQAALTRSREELAEGAAAVAIPAA